MHALQPIAARTRSPSITTLDGSDLCGQLQIPRSLVRLSSPSRLTLNISNPKLNLEIGFLFRNKASFTHAAKHNLVKLTILPILDFGDVIYKIAYNTLLSKLDVVYHSAIRFVTKAP